MRTRTSRSFTFPQTETPTPTPIRIHTGKNRPNQGNFWLRGACLGLAILLSTGCGEQDDSAGGPPPPGVVVTTVTQESISPTFDLIGRVVAVNDVSIQSRVKGELIEVKFSEGSTVTEGQDLFLLDPRPYQAEVNKQAAELKRAEAALNIAERNYQRSTPLFKKGVISESEMDTFVNDRESAAANYQAAIASLEAAQLELDYTVISSPVTGRISTSENDAGDMISPESGTLTTIVSMDPVQVEFSISERSLLAVQNALKGLKKEERNKLAMIPRLRLGDGSIYAHDGVIDFMDNRIDLATGTIKIRAQFDNPDNLLVPGQFVTVLLTRAKKLKAVLVPQASVQEDQAGRFVMVVDDNNKIELRRIQTERQHEMDWIITAGVTPGERILIEGLQKVRPGMAVTPTEQTDKAFE